MPTRQPNKELEKEVRDTEQTDWTLYNIDEVFIYKKNILGCYESISSLVLSLKFLNHFKTVGSHNRNMMPKHFL